jgi:hypothetical protein
VAFASRNNLVELSTDPTPQGTAPQTCKLNALADVRYPARRGLGSFQQATNRSFDPLTVRSLGMTGGEGTVADLNLDLLMSHVVSFEIQVLRPEAVNTNNNAVQGYDFEDLATAYPDNVYDTGLQEPNTTNTVMTNPALIRLRAVKITLRVWDPNTQQSRQITIIQDL